MKLALQPSSNSHALEYAVTLKELLRRTNLGDRTVVHDNNAVVVNLTKELASEKNVALG